ncbi:MAG: hypothetical protein QGG71_27885, partial [Pirellulaceae bacterium]|nr:hypothetical protein [Pirellulaceae bacterium]
IKGVEIDDIKASQDDVAKTRRALMVVGEAISMQQRAVREAEARANAAMRIENQGEHTALLSELRDKLLEAEQAAIELEKFYGQVENMVPRSMRFRGFGEFNSTSGRMETVQAWTAEGEEFDVFNDEPS